METLTEEELKIKEPSQELILEAIRTLPLTPEFVEVSMSADGINLPEPNEEGGIERYFAECVEKGVIPYSTLSLKYDSQARVFFTKSERLIPWYETHSKELKRKIIQKVIKGGRIHEIHTKTDRLFTQENFEDFRGEFLDSLLENGYQLHRGELTLSTYHLTGYNQGDYSDTTLNFDLRFRRGLELSLGSKLPEEDVTTITDWFKQLRDK